MPLVDRSVLTTALDSIPGRHRHHVLLQTSRGYLASRRNSLGPFLTRLRDHAPRASICIYVWTERKVHFSSILAGADKSLDIPNLQ